MLKWIWLSLVMIIFDQVTKMMATANLQLFQPYEVIPYFNLTLMHNAGAAFSFLSDAGGWQRWFFSVLALGVSIFIVFWMKNLKSHERWHAIALAMVLSGAVGNLIDRVRFGYVVDFLDFYYKADSCVIGFFPVGETCHWPAFNVADSAIFIGAAMLIIAGISETRQDMRKSSAARKRDTI